MTQRNVQLPSDHPRLQVGLAVAALLAIVPTLAVELSGSPLNVFEVKGYLVFHNVCEFFSIMVSLSIFGVSWFAHEQSRDRHALFLGCVFLVSFQNDGTPAGPDLQNHSPPLS